MIFLLAVLIVLAIPTIGVLIVGALIAAGAWLLGIIAGAADAFLTIYLIVWIIKKLRRI